LLDCYDIDKAAYYAQLAKDAAAKVHEKTKDSDKEITTTAEEDAQIPKDAIAKVHEFPEIEAKIEMSGSCVRIPQQL
jgi:hypothetical protein